LTPLHNMHVMCLPKFGRSNKSVGPREKPAVRPAPHEPHPPASEPAHTEADTPHAVVDVDTTWGPLSGMQSSRTSSSPHHYSY